MARLTGYDVGDFDMGGLIEGPSESLADITGVVTGVSLGETVKGMAKGGLTTAGLGLLAGAPTTSILGPVAASMVGKGALSPFGQASESLAEMLGATKGSTTFGNIFGKGAQVAFSLAFPQLALPAHIVNELMLSPALASVFSGFFPDPTDIGTTAGEFGYDPFGFGFPAPDLGTIESMMSMIGGGRSYGFPNLDLSLPTLESLGLTDVSDNTPALAPIDTYHMTLAEIEKGLGIGSGVTGVGGGSQGASPGVGGGGVAGGGAIGPGNY